MNPFLIFFFNNMITQLRSKFEMIENISIKVKIILFLFVLFNANVYSINKKNVTQYSATPNNSVGIFEPIREYTTDFTNTSYKKNWQEVNNQSFATWTFIKENVKVEDNNLQLWMNYHPHKVGKKGRELYFTSGMIRSKSSMCYGYYEARIKGASVFKGTCPAFWLYSLEKKDTIQPRQPNTIVYNEIDIIELGQVLNNIHTMSCNLHLMVLRDNNKDELKPYFVKAGKYPKMLKNETNVDWDYRDDFHIYACENRPDSIIWYIDNEKVAARPNYYWHMNMFLTLSLGLRSPFEVYKSGERLPVPTTYQQSKNAGFPTQMYVDYVKVWRRKDYSQFKSLKRNFTFESLTQ